MISNYELLKSGVAYRQAKAGTGTAEQTNPLLKNFTPTTEPTQETSNTSATSPSPVIDYVVLSPEALKALQEDDTGVIPDMETIKEVIIQELEDNTLGKFDPVKDAAQLEKQALELQTHLKELSAQSDGKQVRFERRDETSTITIAIGETAEAAKELSYNERIMQGYVTDHPVHNLGGGEYKNFDGFRMYHQYERENTSMERNMESNFTTIARAIERVQEQQQSRNEIAVNGNDNTGIRTSIAGDLLRMAEQGLERELKKFDARIKFMHISMSVVREHFAKLNQEHDITINIDELLAKHQIY